jgi:hypothetical protein
MGFPLVTGLSKTLPAQSRGPHRHIIVVNTRAQLRWHINRLKKGEKLVVAFSAPGCKACMHYYRTYYKYNYVDRGKHKFLWAKGSFVRRFTQRFPAVFIANSTGVMYPISRYSVLQKLGVLPSRPRVIYRPLPRMTPMKPPRPRFVKPLSPRPTPPKPKPPVSRPVAPKPWTPPKPKPKVPTAPVPRAKITRFYPFGNRLFCIEVRTNSGVKSAPKPSGAVSSPAPRPEPRPRPARDSGGDDDMVF